MRKVLFKASGNINDMCELLAHIKGMAHEGATLEEVANDENIQQHTRETVAKWEELKRLYFGALEDEFYTFKAAKGKHANSAEIQRYLEAIQRSGAIAGTLEILGADTTALMNEFAAKKWGE